MTVKKALHQKKKDILSKISALNTNYSLTDRIQILVAIELKINHSEPLKKLLDNEHEFIKQIKKALCCGDYHTNNILINRVSEIINNFSSLENFELRNNIEKLISNDCFKSDESRFSLRCRTTENTKGTIIKNKSKDGFLEITDIGSGERNPNIALKRISKPSYHLSDLEDFYNETKTDKYFHFWLLKNCDYQSCGSDKERGLYISEFNRYVFPEDYSKIRDIGNGFVAIKELSNFDSSPYPRENKIFLESILRGLIMGIGDRKDDNLSRDLRHIDLDSKKVFYPRYSLQLFNFFQNNEINRKFLEENIVNLRNMLSDYILYSHYDERIENILSGTNNNDLIDISESFFNNLKNRLKDGDNLKKVNEILQEYKELCFDDLLHFEKGFSFLGADFAFEYKKPSVFA